MVIVALATYVIVCNVEHMAQFGHNLYMSYRKRTVQRMFTDLRTDTWVDRAKRFDRFEPDRRSTKPSSWYIIWAGILLLPQDLWRLVILGFLDLPSRLVQRMHKNSRKGSKLDEEGHDTRHEGGI